MTVGLVFVSHSAKIAEGLVDLARQMAPDVALVAAGGTDDGGIGTSFDLVTAAIAQAESGDGVVMLCDLGSAILTAETALDFLDDDARSRVSIVDAPLVEGGVAAAVAAQTGRDRDGVAAAARTAFRAAGGSVGEPRGRRALRLLARGDHREPRRPPCAACRRIRQAGRHVPVAGHGERQGCEEPAGDHGPRPRPRSRRGDRHRGSGRQAGGRRPRRSRGIGIRRGLSGPGAPLTGPS